MIRFDPVNPRAPISPTLNAFVDVAGAEDADRWRQGMEGEVGRERDGAAEDEASEESARRASTGAAADSDEHTADELG